MKVDFQVLSGHKTPKLLSSLLTPWVQKQSLTLSNRCFLGRESHLKIHASNLPPLKSVLSLWSAGAKNMHLPGACGLNSQKTLHQPGKMIFLQT